MLGGSRSALASILGESLPARRRAGTAADQLQVPAKCAQHAGLCC